MIKIIKSAEIDLSRTIYSKRCNSCRGTRHVNILKIRAEGSNRGNFIALCDSCLKELQKQIGEGE